jgi:hypothetical protein
VYKYYVPPPKKEIRDLDPSCSSTSGWFLLIEPRIGEVTMGTEKQSQVQRVESAAPDILL